MGTAAQPGAALRSKGVQWARGILVRSTTLYIYIYMYKYIYIYCTYKTVVGNGTTHFEAPPDPPLFTAMRKTLRRLRPFIAMGVLDNPDVVERTI